MPIPDDSSPVETLLGSVPTLRLEIPGHVLSGNAKTRSAAVPVRDRLGRVVNTAAGTPKYRAITYSTKEAKAFEERVRSLALYAVTTQQWKIVNYCRVDMVLFNLRLDRENASKTILDALQGIVLHNDSRVLDGVIRKVKDKRGPRAVVTVAPVDPISYGY